MEKPEITLTEDNQRNPWGSGTENITISVPGWIKRVIEEEALAQNKSKSLVVTYLIYCGLKAHIGQFTAPGKNLIRERFVKRGYRWG